MYKIIILSFMIALQACSTSYQSKGFSGGYTETQLDENVFRVNFSGNGYTKKEKAADLSLLRCAELTLNNGYKYFVVINTDNYAKTNTHTTPTTTNTTGSAFGTSNSVYGHSRSTTSGGQTYNVSMPTASNVILMLHEKPDSTFAFNAEFAYKSLTEKYRVVQAGE